MAAMRPELADATASRLAATDPLTSSPADTLQHAAQLMAEHQTAHAVVVDPVTGEPVGILSTLDVARSGRPPEAKPPSAARDHGVAVSAAGANSALEPARAARQDHDRARRLADQRVGHAAEQDRGPRPVAPRADDHQVDPLGLGGQLVAGAARPRNRPRRCTSARQGRDGLVEAPRAAGPRSPRARSA